MKVTKIQAQVKTRGRYSIYVDDKYSFSLSELALINSGIRVATELSSEDIANLKNESETDKIYNRTLGLLARRPRSEWELLDYLKRKSDDQLQINKILNKLSIAGYIDDEDFAKRWVESRRLLKKISKRKLSLELKHKRIPDQIVRQILADDQTDEKEVLKDLIAKKRTQTRYRDDLKLMQYLTRQGFRYEDIKSAFTED